MKERGILFSDEMVRAILDGRKTQTRRTVKLRANDGVQGDHSRWRYCEMHTGGKHLWQHLTDIKRMIVERCPYGVVGDRLWVREAWRVHGWDEDFSYVTIDYRADASDRTLGTGLIPDDGDVLADRWSNDLYRQGAALDERGWLMLPDGQKPHWRPSIFMPRWASRITLEITDVRVQRLQQIGNDDARTEGVERPGACGEPWALFASLWERINGAGSWTANPWVWALTFKRTDQHQERGRT